LRIRPESGKSHRISRLQGRGDALFPAPLQSVHGAKAAILRNVRISAGAILSELKIADDRCQQLLKSCAIPQVS
jgi:hypothetical protein